MGKYQAYPEYKDSGVEWLDEIPSLWRCTRLKRYCKVTDGSHHSPKIEVDGYPFISVTDVGVNSINFSDAKRISLKDYGRLVKEGCKPSIGDVLLTKDGTIGRACIVKEDMPDFVILSSLGLLTPKEDLLNSYLYYYLVSGINVDQMNSMIHGSALRRMTISKIDDLILVLPSHDEQTQIANFLDHETAKIDTLIEKQQQLIKLLKEKRQAVISHAVTKGLNPEAPMKDSGVEWLGEVPEHWVVSRLGFHTLKIGSGKTPKGGAEVYQKEGVLFLRSQNVYDDGLRISESESVYISESIHDEMRTTKVFGGDILLNITGGSIGRTCLVPLEFIEANVNQHVCIIRLPDCLREFISMVLKSTPIKEQIGAIQTGGNREGLNFEQISKFSFALPPESERGDIVQSVKISLAKLDALEEQSNRAIKLMQEHRTALISAAVTGKIDVRNWQAPTPQEQALEQTA